MQKNGLIVTEKENIYLRALAFIKNSSDKRIWTIVLLFTGISLAVSYMTGESNFFSASGGVITVLGLLIFVGISTPITMEEIDKVVHNQISGMPEVKADNGKEVIKYSANVVEQTIHCRARQVLGLSVTVDGTIVWAYGWVIETIPCFPSS